MKWDPWHEILKAFSIQIIYHLNIGSSSSLSEFILLIWHWSCPGINSEETSAPVWTFGMVWRWVKLSIRTHGVKLVSVHLNANRRNFTVSLSFSGRPVLGNDQRLYHAIKEAQNYEETHKVSSSLSRQQQNVTSNCISKIIMFMLYQ